MTASPAAVDPAAIDSTAAEILKASSRIGTDLAKRDRLMAVVRARNAARTEDDLAAVRQAARAIP